MKSSTNALRSGLVGIFALSCLISISSVNAEERIYITLGTEQNAMEISPANLWLSAGKPIELVIVNGSNKIHHFTAPELAASGVTLGFDIERAVHPESGWVSPRSPKRSLAAKTKNPPTRHSTWVSPRSPLRNQPRLVDRNSKAMMANHWISGRGPMVQLGGKRGPEGATALRPHERITWTFEPKETGQYKLGCAIKRHASTMLIPVVVL